jgi:hypothetical protein
MARTSVQLLVPVPPATSPPGSRRPPLHSCQTDPLPEAYTRRVLHGRQLHTGCWRPRVSGRPAGLGAQAGRPGGPMARGACWKRGPGTRRGSPLQQEEIPGSASVPAGCWGVQMSASAARQVPAVPPLPATLSHTWEMVSLDAPHNSCLQGGQRRHQAAGHMAVAKPESCAQTAGGRSSVCMGQGCCRGFIGALQGLLSQPSPAAQGSTSRCLAGSSWKPTWQTPPPGCLLHP